MKMRKILKGAVPYFVGTSLLFYIAACGSDNDSDNTSSSTTTTTGGGPEEETDEGTYRVTLTALNTNVTDAPAPFAASGTATITVTNGEFKAEVSMSGVSADLHLQNIFTGTQCPTSSSAGADGIIDVVEASGVSGKIIVPLDSDLSSQLAGFGQGPIGGSDGNYVYSESTDQNAMLDDLKAQDPNPDDVIVKLSQDEGLRLDGKVIIIHGVPGTTTLPDTVQSISGLPNTTTLPIACGVIIKDEGGTTGGESTSSSSAESSSTTGG